MREYGSLSYLKIIMIGDEILFLDLIQVGMFYFHSVYWHTLTSFFPLLLVEIQATDDRITSANLFTFFLWV